MYIFIRLPFNRRKNTRKIQCTMVNRLKRISFVICGCVCLAGCLFLGVSVCVCVSFVHDATDERARSLSCAMFVQ